MVTPSCLELFLSILNLVRIRRILTLEIPAGYDIAFDCI
jgi:hypothetical protein